MGVRRNFWWLSLALGVLLAGWGAWAQAAPVRADPAPQTHVYTLSNGMGLWVRVDRRAPTVVHMVWVRAGSIDETDGTSGVAHVLEHMLFKGTDTLAEGEFSQRVAAVGGRDNAFTSRDATAYHQQVPVQHLEAMMRLEADRFAHNRWSEDAFAREMLVVKEERRNRVEESAQARLFELFQATAFKAHPSRRPIIGWMSDLESLVPDDVHRFYRHWYRPSNAAVVVVGDVDVAAVRAMAERHYGRIPAAATPPRKPQTEPVQQGVRRVHLYGRTQQPLVLLGYKVPALAHPDATDPASRDALALTLLAGVLDGHAAARLGRSLVRGELPGGGSGPRRADEVSASFGLYGRGPQLFMLSAMPVAGVSPEQVEQALQDEVLRIAREGVSEAELRRVKNQWAAAQVFQRDSMFAQALELGEYWIQAWPPDASERILQRLRGVSAAEVQSVAQRHFHDTGLTVAVLLPEPRP